MIKFCQKHFVEITILLILCVLYFVLRLPNLTLQPIFADEAIYIRWAQVMKAEPSLRFLPLSDGKTPLFMWLMMPLFKFIDDPLFAGRLLSVGAGFLTLGGVLFLGWKFFNPKVGLWTTFLIVITPFMVFFDRMALTDSMLAAFSIWSLNLALLLIQHQRIDLAMCLGYVLGGGLLTKTPAMFNLLALPATILAVEGSGQTRRIKILKIFGLWIIALLITLTIYNILRLGPGFANLSSRNQDYIFSPLELLSRPLDPFIPHLKDIADWLPKLLTWPIIILMGGGIMVAVLRRSKIVGAVMIWALIPLLLEMFFLKTFTARYILFSIPPLLLLAGLAIPEIISRIKINKVAIVIVVPLIISALPLWINWQLLTAPETANLPRSERSGYFEEWTAGYGLPDIAKYLIECSKKGIVVVGTEGFFGTLPDGLMIYLDKHYHSVPAENRVLVLGQSHIPSDELKATALEHPTFFVANKEIDWQAEDLEAIKKYPKAVKPNGQREAIILFRVIPDNQKSK